MKRKISLLPFAAAILFFLTIVLLMQVQAFASDYYCEGCGISFAYYESEGVWHCDDCNYCYWCIQGGDGPYHCVACGGCDVEVCENCSDSHVSGDGNFGLCKDCAQSMGYHCECGNCYEDYWHCDTCGLCRECIDNGSEPLHCAGCGANKLNGGHCDV